MELKPNIYLIMERAIRDASPNEVYFYMNNEYKESLFKDDELIKIDNDVRTVDKYKIKRFINDGCRLCVSDCIKEKTMMVIPVTNKLNIKN